MPTSPGRPNNPKAPHVRVPSTLQWSRLPGGARDLWVLLDDTCREWQSCRLTLSTIAASLRCSTSAVQKWRRQLVTGGWLSVVPAEHRGQTSLWTPLGRARAVTKAGCVPVDNSGGRVDGRVDGYPPSDVAKGGRASTLDGGATRARVEEQNLAGRVIDLTTTDGASRSSGPSSWPTWCGHCEPSNRLIESLLTPGAWAKCTSCHPSRPVPAF